MAFLNRKAAFVLYLLMQSSSTMNWAIAASSDAFPWSTPAQSLDGAIAHRDQSNALTDVEQPMTSTPALNPANNTFSRNPTSVNGYASATSTGVQSGSVPAGSAFGGGDVAEGNIGPTQSGPGAAGLFTPNSPGNAAALSAQMHAGLEGAPIVDGNGSNISVKIPVATPGQAPSYEQVTRSGITGVTYSSNFSGSKLPLGSQGNPPNGAHSFGAKVSGLPETSSFRFSSSESVHHQPLCPNQQTTAARLSRQANALGPVSGSIQYSDGKTVLFGADGILQISKAKDAVLKLNNGRTMPVSRAKTAAFLKSNHDF